MGQQQQVQLQLTDDEHHRILRALVFVSSELEAYLTALDRGADPRRDAWVLAAARQLVPLAEHLDAVAEILLSRQVS